MLRKKLIMDYHQASQRMVALRACSSSSSSGFTDTLDDLGSADSWHVENRDMDQLIEDLKDAERNRDDNRADSIRQILKSTYGVCRIEQDWTRSTQPTNVEQLGDMIYPLSEEHGPTGHDYTFSTRAGSSISPLGENLIHTLIAERMHCKLNRNFDRADAIQKALNEAHVQLSDLQKEWRADGIRFLPAGHDYEYAPDADPSISSMPEEEIKELIAERYGRKISHDFAAADIIESELKEAGVYLNDADRLWRADGKTFFYGRRRDGYNDEDIPTTGSEGTPIFFK
jgi:cysteinyl-tRNA synthetase